MTVIGVVLAGGKSSRFGSDKAFILLQEQPLWLRAAQALAPLVSQVVISHNRPELFPAEYQVIVDKIKDKGPLGGIYSVMSGAPAPFYLFLPVDLPLVKREILEIILNAEPSFEIVFPRIADREQPLLARYQASCLNPIKANLDGGKLKVRDVFSSLKTKALSEEIFTPVDPRLLSFLNLNTPADLAEIQRTFARGT